MHREKRIETPFRKVGRPPRAALLLLAAIVGLPSWGCVTVAEHRKLERRVIDARPPRVEYALTDEGLRLRSVLDALAAYAGR